MSQVESDRRAVAAWYAANSPKPGDVLVRREGGGRLAYFAFVEVRTTGRHPGVLGRLCYEDGTPDERIARELGEQPHDTFIYPEHIIEVRHL